MFSKFISLVALGAQLAPFFICSAHGSGFVSEHTEAMGENGFRTLLQTVKSEISAGNCSAVHTLVAVDLDDTVMAKSKFGGSAYALRSSRAILAELQGLGVSTLAITARTTSHAMVVSLPAIEQYGLGLLSTNLQKSFGSIREAGLDFRPGSSLFLDKQVFRNLENQMSNEGFLSYSGSPVDFLASGESALSLQTFRGYFKDLIHYAQGVLHTSNKNKGVSLRELLVLTQNQDQFKCLFFIDDQPAYLQGMKETFQDTLGMRTYLYRVLFENLSILMSAEAAQQ